MKTVKLLFAACAAVWLLWSPGAQAASRADIVAAFAAYPPIAEGRFQVGRTPDGRENYVLLAQQKGAIVGLIGPADDVEEVILVIAFTDEHGLQAVLATALMVATVTSDDAALKLVPRALRLMPARIERKFGSWTLTMNEVSRNVVNFNLVRTSK